MAMEELGENECVIRGATLPYFFLLSSFRYGMVWYVPSKLSHESVRYCTFPPHGLVRNPNDRLYSKNIRVPGLTSARP